MKNASNNNLKTVEQSDVNNLYVTQKNLADERKLIYVMNVPNSDYYRHWLKIGDTSEPTYELDNRKNSQDLRKYAAKRIKQYMNTAGLHFKVLWAELAYNEQSDEFFRDEEVHEVLKRSGYERGIGCKKYYDSSNEWFKINLDTACKAIKAVKDGQSAIPKHSTKDNKIIFRPEQKRIIQKTDKLFKSKAKGHESMLWNAKMRFGKTLCALEVAKDMDYHNTLIITHRPEVNQGWFNDFKLLLGDNKHFAYGSKNRGHTLKELKSNNQNYFYFASLQDLVGSKFANGKYDKDSEIFYTKWDLLVIDEAHEGTKTKKAKAVMKNLRYKKSLLLSGTPFNLLGDYNQRQICTWDYTMEQAAKDNWSQIDGHNETNNPYSTLPKVNMYTFQMGKRYKEFIDPYTRFFNFHQFFKVDPKTGNFFHESSIKQFLKNITTHKLGKDNHYPYSRPEYRKRVSHSLWLLPTRASASALKKLMDRDPVFKNYGVINVVKDGDTDDGIANNDDVQEVLDLIRDHKRTITLTVRKLTLGVTIKPWTAVVFLSDTSSATQYLQAAFRAQSPYVRKDKFGQPISKKTNCYIFDFSPERMLTMVSQAVQLNPNNNPLQGKILKKDQISGLKKLLKFMPIVGERDNYMKPYDINTMLRALKRNYAERAVRNGFDDNSLYNDRLLMRLTPHDLKKFDKLQKFVGSNKNIKKRNKFKLNSQGLNQDEYDNANKGKHKSKQQRTPEEQAAIDRLNRAKRQRGKVLPLLRGISIRIPLMIYGMPGSFDSDIGVHDFVNRVDDRSWEEFMPQGVTKRFFKGLIKFYDTDVFIEAGKIIREKVKAIDDKDPIKRTQQISQIFSQFKNPDKETVLTPWRVVNMHLGQTLGGLSYYDDKYLKAISPHWLQNSNRIIFNPSVHILEINSKTGLYPLYMATSLYCQQVQFFKQIAGNEISQKNKKRLWNRILNKNIFVIAKTPMAKDIASRTLVGYNKFNSNIKYEKNLVKQAKKDYKQTASKIEEDLNEMKFDVVIGNPPYQKKDNKHGLSASPIYQYFVQLSKELSNRYISLIMPARWYITGKGLDHFRHNMLNDINIKTLYDFKKASNIFPHTLIGGGISIVFWDKKYDNTSKGVKVISVNDKGTDCHYRHLKAPNINIFIRSYVDYEIASKISAYKSLLPIISPANPFNLESRFIFNSSAKINPNMVNNPIKVYGENRTLRYINGNLIHKNQQWIDKYKVYIGKANHLGLPDKSDNLNVFVGSPKSVCTQTFLAMGMSLHLNKYSANNLKKYLQTKFSRYLISLLKITQNAYRKVYNFVPLQDFTNNSDIDWRQSLDNIDKQLFNKYHFTNKQKERVQNSISRLTNV